MRKKKAGIRISNDTKRTPLLLTSKLTVFACSYIRITLLFLSFFIHKKNAGEWLSSRIFTFIEVIVRYLSNGQCIYYFLDNNAKPTYYYLINKILKSFRVSLNNVGIIFLTIVSNPLTIFFFFFLTNKVSKSL